MGKDKEVLGKLVIGVCGLCGGRVIAQQDVDAVVLGHVIECRRPTNAKCENCGSKPAPLPMLERRGRRRMGQPDPPPPAKAGCGEAPEGPAPEPTRKP